MFSISHSGQLRRVKLIVWLLSMLSVLYRKRDWLLVAILCDSCRRSAVPISGVEVHLTTILAQFKSILISLWCPMGAQLWGGDGVMELKGKQEIGQKCPQELQTSSLESSALEWRTLVNFCHADLQGFWKQLPGNSGICPEQNWESWHSACPAVSRWAKKSSRVNRRQRQLVISGSSCWHWLILKGNVLQGPGTWLEGKGTTIHFLSFHLGFYLFL